MCQHVFMQIFNYIYSSPLHETSILKIYQSASCILENVSIHNRRKNNSFAKILIINPIDQSFSTSFNTSFRRENKEKSFHSL